MTTKTQTTASTTTTTTDRNGSGNCLCGCGELVSAMGKSKYRPGHDARHASAVAQDIASSAAQYFERVTADSDLGSDALRAKAHKMAERLIAKAQAQADREAAKANKPAKASKWTDAEPVKRGRWTYPTRTNGKVTQINEKRDGSGSWTAL